MKFGIICLGVMALPSMLCAQAELCLEAARRAADAHDVPYELLSAIAFVETGRMQGQDVQPWPWTVHYAGKGYWFNSRAEVEVFVRDLMARTEQNFDLGCFQINWFWHGRKVQDPKAFIDPIEAGYYAARYLRELYDELGDWGQATGAYHSRTPELARVYRAKVEAIRGERRSEPATLNAFPLFVGGARGALGSLFPGGTICCH